MGIRRRPNITKALQVLLYVTREVPDMYNALKVIYFADKQHLQEYGRFIYGDYYVALQYGPVPSLAYDIVKQVRGDGSCVVQGAEEYLSLDGNDIIAHRDPDLDLLSESDAECLDEAIERYGDMSFPQLRDISHGDDAFQSADQNGFMSLVTIAESLPNSDELLEYLGNG